MPYNLLIESVSAITHMECMENFKLYTVGAWFEFKTLAHCALVLCLFIGGVERGKFKTS